MPALVLFGRKWLLAGDDLIFPCAVEAIFRILWLFAIPVVLYSHLQNDQDSKEARYVTYLLILFLIHFALNALLDSMISWTSAQGSIMQIHRRSFLLKLVYIKILFFLFEFSIAISAAWYIFFSLHNPHIAVQPYVKVFLEHASSCAESILTPHENHGIRSQSVNHSKTITSVSFWAYIVAWVIGAISAYDPTGSAKFWKNRQSKMNNSSTFFKKSKKMWTRRLKLCCCCLGVNKSNSTIYEEIASFLAAFFEDTDLVSSDVLAGLVILSKRHEAERRRLKFLDSLYNQGYVNMNGFSIPSWMTIENALYFIRLAKGIYSWPIRIDVCNPCHIYDMYTSRIKCCNSVGMANETCCNRVVTALQKITGYASEDIAYMHCHNDIYIPAFFVAVDHKKMCIVLCIRGTMSLADLVTDVDGENEVVKIDHCSIEFQCHRGTIRSARYIYEKLEELKILKSLFTEFSNFHFAITGHSMGGSIGSVLSIMYRSNYPDIRVFSFGPLAVLSESGAKQTYNTIFTVTVGDDMSPRLCVRSCIDLRSDVLKCLNESETPKYKLLLGAFFKCLLDIKLFRTSDKVDEPKRFHEILENSNASECQTGSYSNTERLYAPGRILHLESTPNGIRSCWKTGLNFRRLIVTPRMLMDHQPYQIQKALETLKIQRWQEL